MKGVKQAPRALLWQTAGILDSWKVVHTQPLCAVDLDYNVIAAPWSCRKLCNVEMQLSVRGLISCPASSPKIYVTISLCL